MERIERIPFNKFDRVMMGGTAKQSELDDSEVDLMYVATMMEHVVSQFTMEQDIVYRLSPEKYTPPKFY